MKKLIRKWLGIDQLVSSTTVKETELHDLPMFVDYDEEDGCDSEPVEAPTMVSLNTVLKNAVKSIEQTKDDTRLLYGELEQNIRNLDSKINRIKPVIKVDDPEAEKFIKGVLSKQDSIIRTQQTAIEEKLYSIQSIERSFETKLSEVNRKFDLILSTLTEIQQKESTKETPPENQVQ